MTGSRHRTKMATRGFRVFATLTLLLTAWLSVATLATAQGGNMFYNLHIRANTEDGGSTSGAEFTVSAMDGEVLGACTLEGDASSSPWQYCSVDVPVGMEVSVWQDPATIPAEFAPVENPIVFDTSRPTTTRHQFGVSFENIPRTAVSATGRVVDVAIFTRENGQPAYDACYVLVGSSNVGCDENSDGRVMFAGIPFGSYTVQQTADLGPGRSVDDFTIEVIGNINSAGFESFSATIVDVSGSSSGLGSSGVTSDVAIVTTEGGQSIIDACYILVGYGNGGCDENGDGKITFEDVPLGTYTVQQTADLGPGRSVNDFTIVVTGDVDSSGYERFPASIGGGTGSSSVSNGPVDIALITRDPETGELLTGICYVLVDFSNKGCDENGDGQVTFAAIAYGTYIVHQTQAPAGYPTIDDYAIDVEPVEGMPGGGSFGVPLGFVVKQARDQNAPDTRNVSVVLIDMATRQRVVADVCVELVGASNVGCDEDLRDGQIDFLDVPAGGPYDLRFTNLPDGYEVGTVGGPLSVTIDAGPGAPANEMVFVLLVGSGNNPGIELGDAEPDPVEPVEPMGSVETDAVVGADGVALALDGVTVSGASDIAPTGTAIRAQLIEPDLPTEVDGFANPVGTGIEITLGDGLQPASPLTVTFDAEAVSDWGFDVDPAGDLLPVVFISREDGSGVELADAELLSDGSVVVTAYHLSRIQPSLASVSAFSDWFGDQVLIFAGVRSNEPYCVDQTIDDGDWEFSAIPNELIWTCISQTGDGAEVTFTNNSPEVWRISSDEATPGSVRADSIAGQGILDITGDRINRGTTSILVPPAGEVQFATGGEDDEIVFNAALDQWSTIVNASYSALSGFIPLTCIEAVGKAQCFLDLFQAQYDVFDTVEDAAYGGLVATIMSCLGEVIGKLGGKLVSAVTSIPGALTALFDVSLRALDNNNGFTFTLSRIDEVADEPAGNTGPGAWPLDRNDGPSSLFVWLGANFYGFPDWVACDDANTYCLVGYPGEEHLLVQMSGLDVIGDVEDSATDPRQELLALGLPDESVTQILGP